MAAQSLIRTKLTREECIKESGGYTEIKSFYDPSHVDRYVLKPASSSLSSVPVKSTIITGWEYTKDGSQIISSFRTQALAVDNVLNRWTETYAVSNDDTRRYIVDTYGAWVDDGGVVVEEQGLAIRGLHDTDDTLNTTLAHMICQELLQQCVIYCDHKGGARFIYAVK